MKKKSVRLILMVVAVSVAALFTSCGKSNEQDSFCINGVWELQQIVSSDGYLFQYPKDGNTWLRIYDDSCYYECQLALAPNGTMVTPSAVEYYTYLDKGADAILYLQGSNTYPFKIVDDSTMTIQERGNVHTWRHRKDIGEKRCREIVGVIRSDMQNKHAEALHYVFSDIEEELQTTNHTLIYILIFVLWSCCLICYYAHSLYQNKKRVEHELKRIEQERETMPEPVRQAMTTVVEEFQHSDFYLSLRKRIAGGEHLKSSDWDAIEEHFRSVYPRFASTLFSLYEMSPVEYQVCLLLKLNVPPSDIANVLCKDTSSISSIRSRLFKKVFGKKGSSKDWDAFILSL